MDKSHTLLGSVYCSSDNDLQRNLTPTHQGFTDHQASHQQQHILYTSLARLPIHSNQHLTVTSPGSVTASSESFSTAVASSSSSSTWPDVAGSYDWSHPKSNIKVEECDINTHNLLKACFDSDAVSVASYLGDGDNLSLHFDNSDHAIGTHTRFSTDTQSFDIDTHGYGADTPNTLVLRDNTPSTLVFQGEALTTSASSISTSTSSPAFMVSNGVF